MSGESNPSNQQRDQAVYRVSKRVNEKLREIDCEEVSKG